MKFQEEQSVTTPSRIYDPLLNVPTAPLNLLKPGKLSFGIELDTARRAEGMEITRV
jgi:hypothetical protein